LRASISRTAPSECSTAGRKRLGGISRAGDERLRQLLVLEATAVIQYTKPGRPATSPWLLNLLSRKPRMLAAVALAIKTARIVWAMMTSEALRGSQPGSDKGSS
jgi:transposase